MKIFVLSSGTMGTGIVQTFAQADVEVTMRERTTVKGKSLLRVRQTGREEE